MAVTVVALLAAAVVHYLYGGVRLQTSHDRLSGAAQAQLSVLLGVFVLAKAADYWLDRYDLVTDGGGLITGMTYTDDHAVLPAKNILLGIAFICAVLFFLNVWRRTWLLPSVGLALLALSAILLGLIWPGIVQQFQVKPSEADKESPYIDRNIDGDPAGLRLPGRRAAVLLEQPHGGERAAARAGAVHVVDAAGRPAAGAADLRAEPAGPRLLLGGRRPRRGPLPDRGQRPGPRARGARAGPDRHRPGGPELVEPAHRLHARQRRHRGVRQPAPRRQRRRADQHPVGRGPAHLRRADGAERAWGTTRRGSTSGSRARTTPSSASRRALPTSSSTSVSPAARARPRTRPRRTPARVASRSAASSTS